MFYFIQLLQVIKETIVWKVISESFMRVDSNLNSEFLRRCVILVEIKIQTLIFCFN